MNVEFGAAETGAVLRSLLTLRFRGNRDARSLEAAVKARTGAASAIAFERGRSALRWILEAAAALPAAGSRREVILPALLCRSVLEAVKSAGLEPVLCDVSLNLAMDMQSAEAVFEPDKTLAIIVPHIYGWPSPVAQALSVAERNHGVVIDDAAASLGGTDSGIPLGLHGHAGIYSFSQGKAACAGGGGLLVWPEKGPFSEHPPDRSTVLPPSGGKAAVMFRRFVWYDVLHRFSGPLARTFSIGRARLGIGPGQGRPLTIENRGMAGLQAAVALAQLKKLDARAQGRRSNMLRLKEELSEISALRVIPAPDEAAPTRFAVETPDLSVKRSASGVHEENPLATHLRGQGIEARYAYLPLQDYEDAGALKAAELERSRRLGERLLLLPFLTPRGPGDMARIGKAVRAFFGR
jgi:dTDP-4-amino-4,6-dideoxygalactose transaminase